MVSFDHSLPSWVRFPFCDFRVTKVIFKAELKKGLVFFPALCRHVYGRGNVDFCCNWDVSFQYVLLSKFSSSTVFLYVLSLKFKRIRD